MTLNQIIIINIHSMDQQQDLENSWCDNIPKTDYQLQPMKPKALLNIIDLLKQQNISTLKMKFSFPNEYQKKEFLKLLKEEANDQYFREVGKKEPGKFSEIKKRANIKKGCIFYIGSRVKSEVFIKAYRQKLDQLEKSQNVKIYQLGADIYIESEKKVGVGTIFYSQMMQMHKKLKIYIFYNQEGLWETVTNSEYFKKRLQKIGIESFAKPNRNKHVSFYSKDYQPEEIKIQVLKQYSYHPRVLKLDDVQLSYRDNLRIFDLVFKSIRSTIQQLRQVYEGDLQINKNRSCFVLHLKHKAFQEEPVALISKVVSHLFIMSFPLRHSRSFINFLRRDAKKYPFIIATHYNNIAFCCINRTKIKQKKDLLQIFAPFLQQLNQKSKLTIHLKPNCVLQQNSQMPKMILDLTDECKVDVDDYQKVIQYQKFNIIVRPKNFNSQSKKTAKKIQFGNFLLKLLLLEQKYQQITQDELNQSILNISNLQQNIDQQERRRGRKRNGRESANKYIQKKPQQVIKQAPVRVRGNRIRGSERNDIQQKNKEEKKGQEGTDDSCLIQKQEYSNILEAEPIQIKSEYNGSELPVNYIQPEPLYGGQGFKKSKKDKEIQEILSQKHGIQVKAWKLKVNKSIYNISEENEKKLIKQKCFLVKNLNDKENFQQNVTPIQFSELQIQEIGYLIYKSSDQKYWIPTHMIQRF